MRRLGEDRGAVAVTVALLLLALLGFAALVIDGAHLYWQRAQLQNAADAAALAVALDCAGGDCGDPQHTATEMALHNAAGGAHIAPEDVDIDTDAGRVSVVTQLGDPDGNASPVRTFLAPVLGADLAETTVRAGAIAEFGTSGSGAPSEDVFPLAIGVCDLDLAASPDPPEAAPDDPATEWVIDDPEAEHKVVWFTGGGGADCTISGKELPGNWGWLDTDGDCNADIHPDGTATGNSGASPPDECKGGQEVDELIDTEQPVLIPVHTDRQGAGSKVTFTLVGFTVFEMTGYKNIQTFVGDRKPPGAPPCPNPERCFYGRFTDYSPLLSSTNVRIVE